MKSVLTIDKSELVLEVCPDLVGFVALAFLGRHPDVVPQFLIVGLWGTVEFPHFSALNVPVLVVTSLK